jgi:TolB protein
MCNKFVGFGYVLVIGLSISILAATITFAQVPTTYPIFLPLVTKPLPQEYYLVYTQCEPPDLCYTGVRTIRGIRINGDPEKILTDYESRDPSWSPDGKYIIYMAWTSMGHRIYRMDADGANQFWLSNLLGDDPHYSPDGAKIVYASDRDGDYEIYRADSDGANELQLTDNSDDDFNPRSSPDGTKLLFRLSSSVNDSAIYKMNANGSEITRLSPSGAGFDYAPVWSPNGQYIAFLSSDNLHVMKADGSERTALTNYSGYDFAGMPAWSPDGSKILYAHANEILTILPDGTNATTLHQSPYGLSSPSWSPDGTMIAFSEITESTINGDEWNTFILNIAISQVTQLTFNNLRATAPIWSPVRIAVR